jgi:hypothetical protein
MKALIIGLSLLASVTSFGQYSPTGHMCSFTLESTGKTYTYRDLRVEIFSHEDEKRNPVLSNKVRKHLEGRSFSPDEMLRHQDIIFILDRVAVLPAIPAESYLFALESIYLATDSFLKPALVYLLTNAEILTHRSITIVEDMIARIEDF